MHPDKPPLRTQLLAAREALDRSAIEEGSTSICHQILALPELATAGTVALYESQRGEVDLGPLWRELRALGKRCVFPRVDKGVKILAFAPVDTPANFAVGVLGLHQPPPGHDVDLDIIDLFVVPGLAFDPAGRRIGRGAGYYDATLAAVPRALRVGVCFDTHLIEAVPVDPHDQLIDLVITPTQVYRPASRAWE